VGASADFDFAAFDAERFVQRNGLEILDGHLSGKRDDVMEFIYFTHGIVEDAGDDTAVAMAGRSGVAVGEAEAADEGLAGFVEDEFQAHASGIILTADEAVVLLQFVVAGFVALRLWGHGGILADATSLGRLKRSRVRRYRCRAVMETPCGASGSAGVQGVLRLRLCFAFAKRSLRSG
jgi:hypothetical protein